MIIKDIPNLPEFLAGDDSRLRELLHPGKEPLSLRFGLARASVKPGEKTKAHRLMSAEVYDILRGRGIMHNGAEQEEVSEGCAVDIPPSAEQFIENSGDRELISLCIVDPAWRIEDEDVFS